MTMQELKIFEEKQIRTVWDEVQEKWYFCINDIVAVLTDSKDPADYFKKVRKRDPELDSFVRGTICPSHQFVSTDGKRHSAKCMDLQSMLRLVQSIPRLVKKRKNVFAILQAVTLPVAHSSATSTRELPTRT